MGVGSQIVLSVGQFPSLCDIWDNTETGHSHSALQLVNSTNRVLMYVQGQTRSLHSQPEQAEGPTVKVKIVIMDQNQRITISDGNFI